MYDHNTTWVLTFDLILSLTLEPKQLRTKVFISFNTYVSTIYTVSLVMIVNSIML